MKQLKPGYYVTVTPRNSEKMIVVGLDHKHLNKTTGKWEDVWRLARINKDGEPNRRDLGRWSRFTFKREFLKYVGRDIYAALQE